MEEEIQAVKNEINRLKKELNKKKDNKKEGMDDLEKALHKAIEKYRNNKVGEETPEVKKERKKVEWKKLFTGLLTISKLMVFASFMYVAMVMYKLDLFTESIIIIIAVTLYLILNRMEKIGG